jgi:hypothetical protein
MPYIISGFFLLLGSVSKKLYRESLIKKKQNPEEEKIQK